MAVGGAVLGAAALAFPRPMSRLIGFPDDDFNASARFVGRLYGIRELLRSVHLWVESGRGLPSEETIAANLLIDAGDVALAFTSLVRRDGIDRAALTIAVMASVVSSQWLVLLRRRRALDRPMATHGHEHP